VGHVFVWAVFAALNPTLLAATTVMLLLPHPKRLLLGYLLGALMTSITLGLLIVFQLHGSGAVSTARHTVSPGMDLALGGIALVIAYVLRPAAVDEHDEGRLAARRRRRREAKRDKEPPRWQRTLGRGSARTTFVIGAVLTLPGGSYLIGLDRIANEDAGVAVSVLLVLAFNLIMLMLLELPLVGYALAPDWTPDAVARFRAWLSRNGRRFAVRAAAAIGVLLIVRGVIQLL
jgi:Sap, sulfolipid-1-addressing protein